MISWKEQYLSIVALLPNSTHTFLLTMIKIFIRIFYRRNLGGKVGESIVEDLNVEFMGDLVKFSLPELQQTLGDKTG